MSGECQSAQRTDPAEALVLDEVAIDWQQDCRVSSSATMDHSAKLPSPDHSLQNEVAATVDNGRLSNTFNDAEQLVQAIAYLLTVVFLAAVIGIIKPYFRDFSRKKFAIVAAISFVLIGVVAPRSELAEGASRIPQDDRTTETAGATSSGYAGSLANLATRADFEGRKLDWPLTVDEARLGCMKTSRWAEVDGVKYALNGRAKGQGYEAIEAIWRKDEAMSQLIREELESRGASTANEPPIRINIGDMIAEAGKLCME